MVIKAAQLKMDKSPSDTNVPSDETKISNTMNQPNRTSSTSNNEAEQEGSGDAQSLAGKNLEAETVSELIVGMNGICLGDRNYTPAPSDSQKTHPHKTKLYAPKPEPKTDDKDVISHCAEARSPWGGVAVPQSPQTLQKFPQCSGGATSGNKRGRSFDYSSMSLSETPGETVDAAKFQKPTREAVEAIDPSILGGYPTPFEQNQQYCYNDPYNNQHQQVSPSASSSVSSYASHPTPPHTIASQSPQGGYNMQSYQPRPYPANHPGASPSYSQYSSSQGPGSVESNYMYDSVQNSPKQVEQEQLFIDAFDVVGKDLGEEFTNSESFQPIRLHPYSTQQVLPSTTDGHYRQYPPNLVSPSSSSQSSYDAFSPPMSSSGNTPIASPPYPYNGSVPPAGRQYGQVPCSTGSAHPQPQQIRSTHVPVQPVYYPQNGQGVRYPANTAVVVTQQQYTHSATSVPNTTAAIPVSGQLSAAVSGDLNQAPAFQQYDNSEAPPPYTEYATITPELPNLGPEVFKDIAPEVGEKAKPHINANGKIRIDPLPKPVPAVPTTVPAIPVTFSVVILPAPLPIVKPAITTYRKIEPNPKQELPKTSANEKKPAKKGRKPEVLGLIPARVYHLMADQRDNSALPHQIQTSSMRLPLPPQRHQMQPAQTEHVVNQQYLPAPVNTNMMASDTTHTALKSEPAVISPVTPDNYGLTLQQHSSFYRHQLPPALNQDFSASSCSCKTIGVGNFVGAGNFTTDNARRNPDSIPLRHQLVIRRPGHVSPHNALPYSKSPAASSAQYGGDSSSLPYNRVYHHGSKTNKAAANQAKAFIDGCKDEKLLSYIENGHTYLTVAIAEGPSKREDVLALLTAATTSRPQLKQLLTKRTECTKQSPLFLAVLTGQIWLVQKLVEFGVDDDECCLLPKSGGGYEGYTALQYAAKYGSRCLDSLNLLLGSKKIGNWINMVDQDGMTALQLAIYHHKDIDPKDCKDPKSPTNNIEAIKCLLKNEFINLNIEDNKSGKTSLHLAVDKGDLQIVKLISDAGANVDAPNYDGRTPLHLAASLRRSQQTKLDICQYLLKRGASKKYKDKNKDMPRCLVPASETQLSELLSDDLGGVVVPGPMITPDMFS